MPTQPTKNTYSVYIDWDYAGSGTPDYTQANDNITAYVTGFDGLLGNQKPLLTQMATVGTGSIKLNNDSRRFSPKNSGGALYGKLLPGKPVRIRLTDGVTNWDILMWTKTFKISAGGQRADAKSGVISDRQATIELTDSLEKLRMAKIAVPLQENRRTDQLVQTVINEALNAQAATNDLGFSGNPTNGQTITINGTVFTYVTSLSGAANEIKIGTLKEDTIDNTCAAVNGAAGAGTLYGTPTVPLNIITAQRISNFRNLALDLYPTRYHRLGEAAGVVISDIGTNGKPGTYVNGVTLGSGGALIADPDTGVHLDGVNDRCDFEPLDFNNASFTVMLFLKLDAAPPASQDVFSLFQSFSAGKLFYIRVYSDGSVVCDFYLGAGKITAPAGTITFASGYQWLVFTYEYSTSTATLRVNNSVKATGTCGPYIGALPSAMQLGAFTASGGNTLKGYLDEHLLWLRALPTDDLNSLSNGELASVGLRLTASTPGTLGNAYTFSSGSGAISGNAFFAGGIDLPDYPTPVLDTGNRTIPYAGDQWRSDQTTALTAIQQVVDTERGMFYAKRDGTLVFRNSDYLFTQTSAAAALTLSSEHQQAEADFGADDVYNRVEVTFTPRQQLTTGICAKLSSPVLVPGRTGSERWSGNSVAWKNAGGVSTVGNKVIKLQFTDPSTGKQVAAKNIVLPLLPTTNWMANEAADGSMVDYTTYLPLQLSFSIALTATQAEISVKNIALGPLYVTKLQLTGDMIVTYDPVVVALDDATSQAAYGKRTLAISLPLATDQGYAESVAAYTLSRFKDPLFRVKKLVFRNLIKVGSVNLHSLDVGDVISYTDYQQAETGKYLITGIQYQCDSPQSARMTTTFFLFKLDDVAYAIYDTTLYDSGAYYTL